jgi:hypothetical protein
MFGATLRRPSTYASTSSKTLALTLPTIPESIRRFIAEHIHSVLQLEMLLLLRSTGLDWTPAELAEEMRITQRSAEFRLQDLQLRSLVRSGNRADSYAYVPPSAETDAIVEALGAYYTEAKHMIINLIFAEPGDSARTLAEAFRIRKPRDP